MMFGLFLIIIEFIFPPADIDYLTANWGAYTDCQVSFHCSVIADFKVSDEAICPLVSAVPYTPCSWMYPDPHVRMVELIYKYIWLQHSPLLQLECVGIWREPIQWQIHFEAGLEEQWLYMTLSWSTSFSLKVSLRVWNQNSVSVCVFWYITVYCHTSAR